MRSDDFVYCSRCGEEMSKNARYCMKCGNINYDHPENKNMERFAKDNKSGIYEIGAGSAIKTNTVNDSIGVPTSTGNPKLFFLANVLGFCGVLILYAFIVLIKSDFLLTDFLDSNFSVFCIIFSLVYLYIASLEIIFMKTNNPWWAALIPFYNLVIISRIATKKNWLTALYIIPLIGLIILLYGISNKISIFLYVVPILGLFVIFYTMSKIGKQFGYNGKLSAILFPLFIPIIAFRTNSFNGITYLDANDKNAAEKDYKRRNNLLFIIIIFLFFGISLFAATNYKQIKAGANDVLATKYLKIAEKVLDKTKESIEKEEFSCDGGIAKLSPVNTYYFYYQETYYELGITTTDGLLGNEMQSFVKIQNQNGNLIYSISISDGTYGFAETLEEDLSKDTIVKYKEIEQLSSDSKAITCSRK